MSSLHQPKSTNKAGGVAVPSVRATSPGAEFRDERRVVAARKQAEEKLQNALNPSPTPGTPGSESPSSVKRSSVAPTSGDPKSSTSSGRGSPVSTGPVPSLRRFQISRGGTPAGPLRSAGGGVQKRRGDGAVAVLVEKLRREPHSRRASMVADAAAQEDAKSIVQGPTPAQPRKRPVVNQAEKKWRAERQGADAAVKESMSDVLEKEAQSHESNWEEESNRLARQFEQIALELDGEMDTAPTGTNQIPAPAARPVVPKHPLKYQPRAPNKHRAVAPPAAAEPTHDKPEGNDEDYVYDMYVRHPLPDRGLLKDPLVGLDADHEAWFRHRGIDSSRQDVGVIVITPEDEAYWEDFAEDDDDEDKWDSEDGDSNGETCPTNVLF